MADPSSSACSPPCWSTSDWIATGVIPLSHSPKIWSVSSGDSSENPVSTPAELIANLALPPPMTPSLPFLFSGDMTLDDLTASSPTPSPSITPPFFTLPASRASNCVFPPSCPVLVYQNNNCHGSQLPPEVGLVQAVVVDLSTQSMIGTPTATTATRSHYYDISISHGTKLMRRVPELELQFAPQCPIWFQPLLQHGTNDTESQQQQQQQQQQHPGVVLASYHAPHITDRRDIFYSVRIDSPIPLVHHGVCLSQLSYRPPALSSTHSPIITTKRDLMHTTSTTTTTTTTRPSLLQRLERSNTIPSEVLTSNASMHSVSTRSLSDPFVDPLSPVDARSPMGHGGRKYSVKFQIPNWIADTTDLENNLLKPHTKYRTRVEHKTGCTIEAERTSHSEEGMDASSSSSSSSSWTVTMYHDDAARLAGSRTYLENYIIDRIHERLEGRMLYHFALDQLMMGRRQQQQQGNDDESERHIIVRQRCPENRKTEVYMTTIPLASEACVKAVIGKGGRFINFVRSMTGCTVTLESRSEITNEPFVHIFNESRDKVEEAAALIEEKIHDRT